MNTPSCKLAINGKNRSFWLKSHMTGRCDYELLIDNINLVEELHRSNKQNDLINDEIDKLEVK